MVAFRADWASEFKASNSSRGEISLFPPFLQRIDRFAERAFGDFREVREFVMGVPLEPLGEVLRDRPSRAPDLIAEIKVSRGASGFNDAPDPIAQLHGQSVRINLFDGGPARHVPNRARTMPRTNTRAR